VPFKLGVPVGFGVGPIPTDVTVKVLGVCVVHQTSPRLPTKVMLISQFNISQQLLQSATAKGLFKV
jgi:hypothetical protein